MNHSSILYSGPNLYNSYSMEPYNVIDHISYYTYFSWVPVFISRHLPTRPLYLDVVHYRLWHPQPHHSSLLQLSLGILCSSEPSKDLLFPPTFTFDFFFYHLRIFLVFCFFRYFTSLVSEIFLSLVSLSWFITSFLTLQGPKPLLLLWLLELLGKVISPFPSSV